MPGTFLFTPYLDRVIAGFAITACAVIAIWLIPLLEERRSRRPSGTGNAKSKTKSKTKSANTRSGADHAR